MKTIIFATGNQHKLKEVREIFSDMPVLGWDDAFDEPFDVVEDGETFEENAKKKLEYIPDSFKKGVDLEMKNCIFLADDSGIEVNALDGRPGIRSARYTEEGTSESWCKKMLSELEGEDHRKANFTAAIAVKIPNLKNTAVFLGRVFGAITTSIDPGVNGFGYDPIFIPRGYLETFSQMSREQKNKISHRFKGLLVAKQYLSEIGLLE